MIGYSGYPKLGAADLVGRQEVPSKGPFGAAAELAKWRSGFGLKVGGECSNRESTG